MRPTQHIAPAPIIVALAAFYDDDSPPAERTRA